MEGNIGARDRHVPPIGFLSDRDRLGCALNGSMHLERDAANVREREDPTIQRRAVAVRGSGEAAVAVLEGGAPRLIASANAAEERLLGPLQTPQHVLQDLGMDLTVDWASGFEIRQFVCLVMVVGETAHRSQAVLRSSKATL